MLTMAVEDPPVTRRGSFADFVIRLVAAAILVGSVIGLAVVAVFAFGVHPLFDEWQVGVVALLIAAPLVGLVLGARYVLRRRNIARGWASYLRLLALAALPGIVVGGWISTFVGATMADAWVHFSAEGNPHGPGVTTLTSAPAPASLASLMLMPTDLGAGWYTRAKPNPSLMPTSSQETSQGQLVRVKDFIDTDHWTGSVWRNDGATIEVLLHFDSVIDANKYPDFWKSQNPGATLSPNMVGQTLVTEGVTAAGWRFASFTVADDYFEVQEDNVDSMPTAAQFQTVVAAAVAKAVTP
jgi:membrane-associated protease RseP (regulator of RpoE activity)